MSEFSESYHLRAASQRDAQDLLRAAGLRGYVFPAEGGWVALVAEGEPFELNAPLVAANTGVLLRYVHAAGHGWGFELFRGPEPVSRYLREYGHPDSQVRMLDLDLPLLRELLGEGFARLGNEELSRIFDVPDEDREEELDPAAWPDIETMHASRPATLFAEAAGLSWYSWVSYAYAEADYDAEHLAEEGVIRVE